MGADHIMSQGEGGDQGDPLMTLLFAIGLHDALVEVQASMQPGEHMFAYLDDVHVIAPPERIRLLLDSLREVLSRRAGAQLNDGNTNLEQSRSVPAERFGPRQICL